MQLVQILNEQRLNGNFKCSLLGLIKNIPMKRNAGWFWQQKVKFKSEHFFRLRKFCPLFLLLFLDFAIESALFGPDVKIDSRVSAWNCL